MGNYRSIIIYFKKKAYLTLGLFFLLYSSTYSQNQRIADSLEIIYLKGNFEEQDRLKILIELAVSNSNPEKKLKFSEELIQIAQLVDSIDYLFQGLLQKGTALRKRGDLSQALGSYFQAAKIAVEEGVNRDLGIVNITIADVYSDMEDHNNAIHYYKSAITILRGENDSINVASALLNAGDEYFNIKKYDSAMIYYKESGIIFKKRNYLIGTAYNLGNIGMIYAEQGKDDLAKQNINQAITILEELEDYSPISEYLISMSNIYADQNDMINAFSYAQRSLELAQKYGLKKQISEANLKLSELYERSGNLLESYKLYKDHIVYRDSVNDISAVQQLTNLRADFEIQKTQDEIVVLEKEAVINELKDKRNKIVTYSSAATTVLILFLAISIYRRYSYVKKTSLVIEEEKNKSEVLLLNILPEETALELKENGRVRAKHFESVTVMFTDFKDFTRYSQNLSPDVLVKSVDFYFSKFDEIIEKYGLEKIKTIGDAYMCAGGLPFPAEDHAIKMVQAAFEISEFISNSKKDNNKDITHFDLRIGINTGSVVAGVVGTKKFAYDIWGDTVNVASRMESASKPGKINISENTYVLIKDKYDCKYRGEIEVKNKGMMKMYFVNKAKVI